MAQSQRIPLWLLPESASQRKFLKHLRDTYDLKTGRRSSEQIQFLDSTDWCLFKAGCYLQAYQHHAGWLLELHNSEDGRLVGSAPVNQLPRFITDIPAGVLHNKLQKQLSTRTLVPICEVQAERTELLLQDGNGKILLRLYFDKPMAQESGNKQSNKSLPFSLAIVPVRGYETTAQELSENFSQTSELIESKDSPFEVCSAALNISPSIPKSESSSTFTTDEPANKVIKHLLQEQFNKIRKTEAGLADDIVPEYLCDYQLAIRDTRNLLDNMHEVFSGQEVEHFEKEFEWLDKVIDTVRENDVMLTELNAYLSTLNENHIEDLKPLSAYLNDQQQYNLSEFVEIRRGVRHAALVHDWQEFIQHIDEIATRSGAGMPTGKVVKASTSSIYQGIISAAENLSRKSTNQEYRQLYELIKSTLLFLGLFQQFYNKKIIKELVKQLNSVQDMLGEFYALEACTEILDSFLSRLKQTHPEQHVTRYAIRSLVAQLNARKAVLIDEFHTQLDRFVKPRNQQRFIDELGLEVIENKIENSGVLQH